MKIQFEHNKMYKPYFHHTTEKQEHKQNLRNKSTIEKKYFMIFKIHVWMSVIADTVNILPVSTKQRLNKNMTTFFLRSG